MTVKKRVIARERSAGRRSRARLGFGSHDTFPSLGIPGITAKKGLKGVGLPRTPIRDSPGGRGYQPPKKRPL